jgi:hypothetical protein
VIWLAPVRQQLEATLEDVARASLGSVGVAAIRS